MSEKKEDATAESAEEEGEKSQHFKMITVEEWDTLLNTLSFFYNEYEKNKTTIKDIYTKIEEIKNEK